MSAVGTNNELTGFVVPAPTYDQATGTALIPIFELPADFDSEDQHRMGKINIQGFGSFDTDQTLLSGPMVRIRNAIPGITLAKGAEYTLWDDDVGYVLAFEAPPVVLPKVPDLGLMDPVYAHAYVDPLQAPGQYYQDNAPFRRNVRNHDEAEIAGNTNRDLISRKQFWAVHVTSAFQGYTQKDGDPDVELSESGVQFGLTIDFPIGGVISGSLIFLENIRDFKKGHVSGTQLLEKYTVVHETGHQFWLSHGDGHAPPPGPLGDFIMTEILNDSGMAPNVAFSPTSLNKIREIEFPQPQ